MDKKIAVLLVNLGTPEKPEKLYLKKYLRQFLSDTRIVEANGFLKKIAWQSLLNLIILNTRPKQSALKYQSVWLKEGAPLLVYTQKCTQKIAQKFANSPVCVDFAMRYGEPSILQKLAQFQQNGIHKILIAPLYAQYSATTIASIMDEVARYLLKTRHQPQIRALYGWHDDWGYIHALVQSVKNALSPSSPPHLILSFHGIPQKCAQLGDPYPKECLSTANLIREGLKDFMPLENIHLSFQSRFGPAPWLQPYTIDLLSNFPQKNIKNLAVLCPGFAVDCLETLEEIAIWGKNAFFKNKGENFIYIPALNDSELWMDSLFQIIQKELSGWI